MNNTLSRRSKLYFNVQTELTINKAINEIECLGSDVRLTNAQIKLQEAKDLISDFVDEQIFNQLR